MAASRPAPPERARSTITVAYATAASNAAPSAMRAAVSPESAKDSENPYPTSVKVAAQARVPARLHGTKRRSSRPEAPATNGDTARTRPTKRPSSTALPPWRA